MNIGNRNFINEAIDTWSKLAQVDAFKKQQDREEQKFAHQQQDWGREAQLRDLMGTNPEDNAAVAQATGMTPVSPLPVTGMAPSMANPTEGVGNQLAAADATKIALSSDPVGDRMTSLGMAVPAVKPAVVAGSQLAAADATKAALSTDPAYRMKQLGVTVPPAAGPAAGLAPPADAKDQDPTAKLQQVVATLQQKNEADKADYLQGLDAPEQMTDNAARLIMREVVNNPAYSENDPFGQLQAITKLQGAIKNMPAATQPFMLNDPVLLATYDQAFPHVAGKSNLEDAKTRALFITPDPSGDPLKAKIAVGLSGKGADGTEVQGVMTENRTSDPSDVVYNTTTGEWLGKAQNMQRNIEGLLLARAKLGDEKAFATYADLRKGKEIASILEQQAAKIKNPDDRSIVQMNAYLVKNGTIKPEDGFNSSIKIFGEQSALGRDLAKKEAEFNLQRKLDLATPEGQAKDATAQQTLDTRVGEEAYFNGKGTAGLTPGQEMAYGKAKAAQEAAAAKLKKDVKTVKVDVGGGNEQTFQYNDETGNYDKPIGKPGPKWAPTARVAGDGATAEIKNLNYYRDKLGFTPVELKQQVQQGKVKLSDMVTKIYADLKKNDSRGASEEELINTATQAAGKLYQWANAQGDSSQVAPKQRDVSSVTDYFSSVGKLESNKSAVDNVVAKGWTPEEVKRAAKGTDLEKTVKDYPFPRGNGLTPASAVSAPAAAAPQRAVPVQGMATTPQAQPVAVANPFVPATPVTAAPVVAARSGLAPAQAKPPIAAAVKGQPYSVVQNGRIVVKFQ